MDTLECSVEVFRQLHSKFYPRQKSWEEGGEVVVNNDFLLLIASSAQQVANVLAGDLSHVRMYFRELEKMGAGDEELARKIAERAARDAAKSSPEGPTAEED